MKYFRKHPDLIVISNFPKGATRVRHGRQTTPQELATILVHTIASKLKNKKILLLTDAEETAHGNRIITRTSWSIDQPLSFKELAWRLLYNFQTPTICMLYHSRLFGVVATPLISPLLLGTFRLSGKKCTVIFLTTPAVSAHPTLPQAIRYFTHVFVRWILRTLAYQTIDSEKARSVGTLKKRNEIGKSIADELFPSPTKNLGLLAS